MKDCLDITDWIKKTKIWKDQKGTTTILVICVMAVIMALSMGLFLTAASMTKTSGRTLASEQCRILAETFCQEIMEEGSDAENSLFSYVSQHVFDGSWPYYRQEEGGIHDKEHAVRDFCLQKGETVGEIADITITVYWTPEKDPSGATVTPPFLVYVTTTVEVKQQECSITDVYECRGGSGKGNEDFCYVERR